MILCSSRQETSGDRTPTETASGNISPRRDTIGEMTPRMVFELKEEYQKECSPFFYHYREMDHSKVYIT